MTKGLLFDMDGVLVDTEKIHEIARYKIYNKHNINIEKIKHIPVAGRNTNAIFGDVSKIVKFPIPLQKAIDEKRELFVSMLNEPIELLPGVIELLQYYSTKFPLAIVSASAAINIKAVIKNTGIKSYFKAVVSAEDVKKYKPDPESYILGASRIGLLPEECVVFEDSSIGVKAAKAAEMKVVGIKTGINTSGLESANIVVENLKVGEIAIKKLIGL